MAFAFGLSTGQGAQAQESSAGESPPAAASTEGLAAAAQNPVAAMYSLPLQNNTYFGAGPDLEEFLGTKSSCTELDIGMLRPIGPGGGSVTPMRPTQQGDGSTSTLNPRGVIPAVGTAGYQRNVVWPTAA
jgi:hypothetical protein